MVQTIHSEMYQILTLNNQEKVNQPTEPYKTFEN